MNHCPKKTGTPVFEKNYAKKGGAIYSDYATFYITDCSFVNNSATWGGAIYTSQAGTMTEIVNTTIANNSSDYDGGGIYVYEAIVRMMNVTIANNIASNNGGGLYAYGGCALTLYNCIIAQNQALAGKDVFAQKNYYPDVFPVINANNNLFGIGDSSINITNGVNGNIVGTELIPANPLFGTPIITANGQYILPLQSNSIARGAGDTSYVRQGVVNDVAGKPIPQSGVMDLGAAGYSVTSILSSPTNFKSSLQGQNAIALVWDEVPYASYYKIEYSISGVSGWTQIGGNLTSTSYNHTTTLSVNTSYYYRISTVNSVGPSPVSSTLQVKTLPNTPSIPTGLKSTGKTSNTIVLSWDGATSNTSYKLEYSTNGTTGWTEIECAITDMAYTHSGLSANTLYYYRITAVNPGGSSAVSQMISVTTDEGVIITVPFTKMVAQECCSVFLQAVDIFGENLTYWWDLSGTGDGTFVQKSKSFWVTVNTLGFSIGEYTIRMLAKNSSGTESEPVSITLRVVIEAPANFNVTKTAFANDTVLMLDIDGYFPSGRVPQSWTINWGDSSDNYTCDLKTTFVMATHYYQQNESDTAYPITLSIVNSMGEAETYFLGSHVVPGLVASAALVESALPVIASDEELFTFDPIFAPRHKGTEVLGDDLFITTDFSDNATEKVAGYSAVSWFDPAFALVAQAGWSSFTRFSWNENYLLSTNSSRLVDVSLTDWFEDFAHTDAAVPLESINWQLQLLRTSKSKNHFALFEGEFDYFDNLFEDFSSLSW